MITKKTPNSPIGVFDSGLGGLTVLKSLEKILPNESFIYFGDTAHVPYGNKSVETIIVYSQNILDFFLEHHTKAVVIACNTVSAVAYNSLQKACFMRIHFTGIRIYFTSKSVLRRGSSGFYRRSVETVV